MRSERVLLKGRIGAEMPSRPPRFRWSPWPVLRRSAPKRPLSVRKPQWVDQAIVLVRFTGGVPGLDTSNPSDSSTLESRDNPQLGAGVINCAAQAKCAHG